MRRVELLFVAFCLACWVVSLVALAGLVDLSGRLDVSLRQLYAVAAAAGWISGNVWMQRTRNLPAALRRRFWVVYFFGPPGFFYLLHLLRLVPAPVSEGGQVDLTNLLVPMLSFFVFATLFAVPVVLRSREPRARTIQIGSRHTGDGDKPNDGTG